MKTEESCNQSGNPDLLKLQIQCPNDPKRLTDIKRPVDTINLTSQTNMISPECSTNKTRN